MDRKKADRIEKPKQLVWNNVCFWYEQEGKILGSVKKKVEEFLFNKCIEKVENDLYVCRYIPGYNQTTHKIDMKNRKCSCQHSVKVGTDCSHIMAVDVYLYMESYNG